MSRAPARIAVLGGLVWLCSGCALPFTVSGASGPLVRAPLWSSGDSPSVAYPRSWTLEYPHDLVGGTFVVHLAEMTNRPNVPRCVTGTVSEECEAARAHLADLQRQVLAMLHSYRWQ